MCSQFGDDLTCIKQQVSSNNQRQTPSFFNISSLVKIDGINRRPFEKFPPRLISVVYMILNMLSAVEPDATDRIG